MAASQIEESERLVPGETTIKYLPKIKLFEAWCDEKIFTDGYTVTEPKLVLRMESIWLSGNQKPKESTTIAQRKRKQAENAKIKRANKKKLEAATGNQEADVTSDASADEPPVWVPFSQEGLQGYIKSIIHLYELQVLAV
jgi:hypothetical protein